MVTGGRYAKGAKLYALPASDWFAAVEAAREARLGYVNPRAYCDPVPQLGVGFRAGRGSTVKVKKMCAVCGSESRRSLPNDGRSYHCTKPDCRQAAARKGMADRRADAKRTLT